MSTEKSKNDIAKECKKCYYDEKCYVSRRKFGRRRSGDKAGSFNDIRTGMPENFAR